jgi:hypothetical protein
MNDYTRGALEALAWVESLLGRVDPDQLKREVAGARGDLLAGLAVDFRDRLRASWAFK